MPRPPRTFQAGQVYHVLNRGNARQDVFLEDEDYRAFTELLGAACARRELAVLAWCLLPNHFHLILQPQADGDLSPWMQWLSTSHVRRHHSRHAGAGHLWQGRYKSFPIQSDTHLLAALRFVEGHPRRSGLVPRAEDWPWSSLAPWPDVLGGYRLEPEPPRSPDWLSVVNAPQDETELAAVVRAVKRGQPLGDPAWQVATAQRLGLESSLRSPGRPRKTPPAQDD